MRCLFYLSNCPHCAKYKDVITQINSDLPVGEQIDMVNILLGDPRVAFLAKRYGSWDKSKWFAPVLVLDSIGVVRKHFGVYDKGNKQRILIEGSPISRDYLKTMLIELLLT